MNVPLITVLITTYNYGRFIEEAIKSVLAQDYAGDKVQIVVVDDGSTDDTAERIGKFGPRVEYFLKTNGGQASALNFGFAKARGEIVALLDADDLFLPNKLSRIASAFEADPSLGMIYHRTREWKPENNEYREYEFFPVSGDLHKEPEKFAYYIPQPTTCVCFRRSSVEALLPIPENVRMNADCFIVALIPFVAPVLALPEFLSVYRIHGKNSFFLDRMEIPREEHEYRRRTWETVIEAMRGWLASHGYTKALLPVRSYLERWEVLTEREAFAIEPPGRIQYFRYQLKAVRYRLPLMSRRLALLNYVDAVAALVVGYKGFPRWEKMRERLLGALRVLFGKKTGARSVSHS